jgi:hypothetical protein
MKLHRLLMAFVLAGGMVLSLPACAQTTRPAGGADAAAPAAPDNAAAPVPAAWSETVKRFGTALLDGGDICQQYLSPDVRVSHFSRSAEPFANLTAHTGGARLLLSKAYLYPAHSVAGDIASAIAACDSLSAAARKGMVPNPGEDTVRANDVADQWVQRALGINKGQPFAVMVFLEGDPSQADSSDSQILFVLIRPQYDAAAPENGYKMRLIVFGDPQQAATASH